MKKNIFLYGALALGMTGMFASCSSDDDIVVNGGGDADATAQVIEIAVDNANNLSTRSGRPLNSEAALHDIDNVAVIVTDVNNDVKYVEIVDNWMSNSAVEDYTHGRKTTVKIPDGKKLDKGTYSVYAIGYDNETEYTVAETSDGLVNYLSNLETNMSGKFDKDMVLSNGTGNTAAEEIFAGSSTANVAANEESFTQAVNVVMHRQVAGVYTYIKDVPYYTSGANVGDILQLVAVTGNSNLTLGGFLPTSDLASNGGNPDNKYVNGFNYPASVKETVVYSINLKDWFGQTLHDDGQGLLDKSNWTVPEREYAGNKQAGQDDYGTHRFDGCTFVKGSVFGGEFVIPFLAVDNKVSFKLKLISSTDGSQTPLKTWNIKLASADVVSDAVNYWNATALTGGAWTTTTATSVSGYPSEESTSSYSIMRNHLYGVGTKVGNNPADDPDPDPENPDPGKDEPTPLVTDQDLVLKLNANWEIIHRMEIEEDN